MSDSEKKWLGFEIDLPSGAKVAAAEMDGEYLLYFHNPANPDPVTRVKLSKEAAFALCEVLCDVTEHYPGPAEQWTVA